jgi:putative lipoprotein
MTFKNGILALACVLLAGCVLKGENSSQRIIDKINSDGLKNYSPYKLVEIYKGSNRYEDMPNGEIILSYKLLETEMGAGIMSGITDLCGFRAKNLREIRSVINDTSKGYMFDVWVFNDPLSRRDDKITSISVILLANPIIGGTDIWFYAPKGCHDEKSLIFTFGK